MKNITLKHTNKMDKEFVPYEQSQELKSLGFDEECFSFYDSEGELYESEGYYRQGCNVLGEEILAPTFSQAFRFFREKHGLFAEIKPYLIVGTDWWYKISDRNNSSGLPYEVEFETYEEAELACLQKLIEIVK